MIHRLACAVLCGLAVQAHAGTPIQETRRFDGRGELSVANIKGSIHVRAWDRDEVRIEGELGDGVDRLDITGDASDLSVRVRYPNRSGLGLFGGNDRTGPTHLRLTVPHRISVAIESVAADVDVEGLGGGELEIDSVSGTVRAVGAPSQADIQSVSGDITATLNSDGVDIDTVSGTITLRGRLGGEVGIETVAGDAIVEVHPGSTLRSLSAASVSGDLRVRAALAKGGTMEFESVSGDIDLRLPRATSAQLEANSFSGALKATGARVQRSSHGPGSRLEQRYGAGDGEIEVETFSGDMQVVVD